MTTPQAEAELPATSSTPIRGSANSATIKSRDRSPLSVKTGKDIDLIETANILLQKLPKGWHKVSSFFNLFLPDSNI